MFWLIISDVIRRDWWANGWSDHSHDLSGLLQSLKFHSDEDPHSTVSFKEHSIYMEYTENKLAVCGRASVVFKQLPSSQFQRFMLTSLFEPSHHHHFCFTCLLAEKKTCRKCSITHRRCHSQLLPPQSELANNHRTLSEQLCGENLAPGRWNVCMDLTFLTFRALRQTD